MTNTDLISKHIELLECADSKEKICKICGESCTQYFPQKKILSEKFNDYDCCKSVKSDVVCVKCASCIKNAALRRSCFYCDTEKLVFFKKNDIENLVFDLQVKPPFVFCFTESFKKHNSFKAVMNYSTKKYCIQAETERFVFDVQKMKPLYEIIKKAYFDDLLSKNEILTGQYKTLISVEKLIEYDNEFKKHRNQKYFYFLVYMLNSEIKNEILKKKKEEKKNAGKRKNADVKRPDNCTMEQLGLF